MIDAHVHFWNYHPIKDAWIDDEMKLLQRDFLPNHLEKILFENNVKGVIAVQADTSLAENDFLLNLAQKNIFIKGVVGWIDLLDESVAEKINQYSTYPLVKGFRHIVQAEPKGFLRNTNFRNGISLLNRLGFTYDLLIKPHQLKEGIELVEAFPDQRFVLDHLAKPNIKNGEFKKWKEDLQPFSFHSNVYCKLSGLVTEAHWDAWKEEDLIPYMDWVFECFGTNRIIFGSDWPVLQLASNYSNWLRLLKQYCQQFSKEENRNIFENNATRFYNIT